MRCSVGSDRRRLAPTARTTSDRGQAVVELALCLPVVFVVLLGIVQVAVVVRDELLVQHAAREAARAASVSTASRSASVAATRVLDGARLVGVSVGTSTGAGIVRVEVRASTRTDVPLIGALLGDVTHTATAVMAIEPLGPP